MKKFLAFVIIILALIIVWFLWPGLGQPDPGKDYAKITMGNSSFFEETIGFLLKKGDFRYVKISEEVFRINISNYEELTFSIKDIEEIVFLEDLKVKLKTRFKYNGRDEMFTGFLTSPTKQLSGLRKISTVEKETEIDIHDIKKIETRNDTDDLEDNWRDRVNFRVVLQKGENEFFAKIDDEHTFNITNNFLSEKNLPIKTSYRDINKIEQYKVDDAKVFSITSKLGKYRGTIKHETEDEVSYFTKCVPVELTSGEEKNISCDIINRVQRLKEKDWEYTDDFAEIVIDLENTLYSKVLNNKFQFEIAGSEFVEFLKDEILLIKNNKLTAYDTLNTVYSFRGTDEKFSGKLNEPLLGLKLFNDDVIHLKMDKVESVKFFNREKQNPEYEKQNNEPKNAIVKYFNAKIELLSNSSVFFVKPITSVLVIREEGDVSGTHIEIDEMGIKSVTLDSKKSFNDVIKFDDSELKGSIETSYFTGVLNFSIDENAEEKSKEVVQLKMSDIRKIDFIHVGLSDKDIKLIYSF